KCRSSAGPDRRAPARRAWPRTSRGSRRAGPRQKGAAPCRPRASGPRSGSGMLDAMRLDLVFLALLVPARLRRFAAQVRPHPGNESGALAVGKPLYRRGAGGKLRPPRRVAAVGVDQLALRLLDRLALACALG